MVTRGLPPALQISLTKEQVLTECMKLLKLDCQLYDDIDAKVVFMCKMYLIVHLIT